MCFSPEADAAVGAIAAAVGIDALRHVGGRREILIASLPMLFGVHQISEAAVWWGGQGHLPHAVERFTLWAYLLFALGALPALAPLAVGLIEPKVTRRRVIAACEVLGFIVGVALTVAMLRGPIGARIEGWHISYNVDALNRGGQWTAVYVVATCGALLASSYRVLSTLGAVNLVAIPVLLWMTTNGFVSLWCFWAAAVSIVIAIHLRQTGFTIDSTPPVATSST